MPEPLPPSLRREPVAAERMLSHLYEIGRLIRTVEEPDELLQRILDGALEFLDAERGLVLLRDEEGRLTVRASRGLDGSPVEPPPNISRTAIEEALADRPMISLDAGIDARASRFASVRRYEIRSLICVPFRTRDRIRGVIYIDSRRRTSPFRQEELRFLSAFASQAGLVLHTAELFQRLRRENRRLGGQIKERASFEGLLGRSHAMQRVYALLERAADSHLPVVLLGETGTGKELAARALHVRSRRRARPFLAVNCAAFSEGLLESELFGHVRGAYTGADLDRKGTFELADGGTLLLDEISGMSPGMQAKLLRVLQEGEFRPLGSRRVRRVDVRVLAATNVDLDAAVRQGRFREDLYYRLNVVRVVMPPLRQRREDIPLLAEHFARRAVTAAGAPPPVLGADAIRALTSFDWPGNIRELEHTLQKAVLYAPAGRIDGPLIRRLLEGRPTVAQAEAGGFPSLRDLEARHLRRALEICGGNREEAARRLGIGRATIYRKMKDYGIEIPAAAARPRSGPRSAAPGHHS